MIGEELVFFSFLYIKLFELGVEVAPPESLSLRDVSIKKRSSRISQLSITQNDITLQEKLWLLLLQNLRVHQVKSLCIGGIADVVLVFCPEVASSIPDLGQYIMHIIFLFVR